MRPDLDESVAAMVWKYSVLPTIEEYFYGDHDTRTDYAYERLAAAAKQGFAEGDKAGGSPTPGTD